MKKLEMTKAYKVIGWCMIAYAIIDIALCLLNLLQLDAADIEANIKTFVIVAAIAITAIDAFFYVLAGIAGIKLNFKMGKVAFVALIITSVLYLVGLISGKSYSSDDLRIILMPMVYGCFMFPAKKDTENK